MNEGNQEFRDAWIAKILTGLQAGQKIIDVGCGAQRYRRHCEHLQYTAQDQGGWDGWEYGSLDIRSDICSIPVSDGSFDVVLCAEVLEHVPDPVVGLNELARILRVGGTLILTAPFASITHYAPDHYVTGFNRYFYQHHLTRLKMRIDELIPNGNYFEYLAQEIFRIPSIAKKYANQDAAQEWSDVLCRLKLLSEKDAGSSEILCYGYQVLATKEE